MMTTHITIFFTSFLSSILLTYLALNLAHALDFTADTGDRKIHTEPVAYMGGVAIYLALFIGMVPFVDFGQYSEFLLICFLVTLLGLADDAIDLPSSLKLGILFLLGIGMAIYVGIINLFPLRILGEISYYPNVIVTSLWIVLVVSAMNAIDNMDGLAPGIACITSLIFFIISGYRFTEPILAVLSIALLGATLGFLPFNFHPAKIFLGDSGSFLLGVYLASMAFIGTWSTHPLKAFVIPIVILSVPIVDLIFVVLYRYLIGETRGILHSIEYSAQDHLSHRIRQQGAFGQRRTVLIIYVFTFITGIIGVIMRNTYPFEAVLALFGALAIYAMVILIILPNLNRIRERWKSNNGSHG